MRGMLRATLFDRPARLLLACCTLVPCLVSFGRSAANAADLHSGGELKREIPVRSESLARQANIVRARPILAKDAALAKEAAIEPLPKTADEGWLGAGFTRTSSALWSRIEGRVLRLSQVTVRGNYRLDQATILKTAKLDDAPYLWAVSPEAIREKLLSLPWIDEASVTLAPYPARATIEVQEAEPWLIAEYEKHSWLVSQKGNLLQALDTLDNADVILETTELPRLDGLQSQASLESYLSSANARFRYAVKAIKLLLAGGELPFPVERYTLLPNGALALHPEGGSPQVLVAIRSHEEAQQTVGRLRSVLEDLTARGEQAQRIDLRFRNQAIVE